MTVQEAHEYLEDFQRIMTQHREAYSKKLIEANGQAILALEKQIPKKVNISLKGTTGWNTKCHCPNCRSFISKGKYCSECGQALDWGDRE